MCFVQGLRLVPSAYLMIAASFRAMDPSLEEQSAMAGRGVAQTTLADHPADHAPGAARHVDLLHHRRDRVFRYSRVARFYRAHSRSEHGDLLGDPFGSRIARLRFGVGLGSPRLGCGAVAHVVLSASDRAPGEIHDHHGQGLSAAANQSRRVDGACHGALRCLCGAGGGVAVLDADLDQRAAVLCGSLGGLAGARHLRGLLQNLAGKQRSCARYGTPRCWR